MMVLLCAPAHPGGGGWRRVDRALAQPWYALLLQQQGSQHSFECDALVGGGSGVTQAACHAAEAVLASKRTPVRPLPLPISHVAGEIAF